MYRLAWLFYPGYLDYAQWQLNQATGSGGEAISNWHPPMVSFAMKVFINFFGDVGSLFVFNMVLLWVGIFLILRELKLKLWAKLLLCLVVFFSPMVLPFQMHFYKDIPFGISLLFCCGLMLWYQRARYKWIVLLVPLLIIYAISLRHNGFFALIPFSVCYFALVKQSDFYSRDTWIKGLGVFCILFVSAFSLNQILREESRSRRPVQMLLVHDLAGITIEENKVVFPDFYTKDNTDEPITVSYIKKAYHPSTVFKLLWGNEGKVRFIFSSEHERELILSWFKSVFLNPISYLKHRLSFFYYFLNPPSFDHRALSRTLYRDGYNLAKNHQNRGVLDRFIGKVIKVYSVTENKWFKKSFIYFLIYALSFPLFYFYRKRFSKHPVAISLYMSGFLYFLSYIFIGASVSFKYVWWSILALPFCLLLLAFGMRGDQKSAFVSSD